MPFMVSPGIGREDHNQETLEVVRSRVRPLKKSTLGEQFGDDVGLTLPFRAWLGVQMPASRNQHGSHRSAPVTKMCFVR